jgi:uncharacterized protein (DUF305 family)
MRSGDREMTLHKPTLAAVLAATVNLWAPSLSASEFRLPEQCGAASPASTADHAAMDHSAMGHGQMDMDERSGSGPAGMKAPDLDLDAMPEHVRENLRRMAITMSAMHDGLLIEDPDVAFACGMIAHHQGAIDMAEILLVHGMDPQMRALAEEIIAAQVGEIEEMATWLAARGE